MTYDDLLALARRLDGRTLETVTGRRFRVGIYLDSLVFTPESTGRGQSEGRAGGERFIARYNKVRSLRPGSYAKVSRNASYYVGLILAGEASVTGSQPSRIRGAADFGRRRS